MTYQIFIDISIILSIAIAISFAVQLLKQPMIISYIITGIVCGPLFLNLINANEEFFSIFAEFGVILLLFLVGLSLNINYLKKIGKVALVTGVGQVIFTSIFGFFILQALGFSINSSFYLAISITFSSTIIITKLLSDKRDLRSVYGRYTIGLMLVQDIIAISLMIILPIFNAGGNIWAPLGALLLKTIAMLVVVYLLAKIILPIFLEQAVKTSEFLLIFTLAWCFAIAGLGEWAGISLEVGAIIAGLSLGSSVYMEEISSRIKPLRDFFIALFFIILGSEMTIQGFQSSIFPSIILSLFVLIGNPFILYFLYRIMKFTRRNAFLAGVTSAQVSEFGFVLLFVAHKMGYVNSQEISVFTIVALVTIFISSYLIKYNNQIYRFFLPVFNLFGRDKYYCPVEHDKKYEVILFGFHRLGWRICEGLEKMKISYAVVDFDPEVVDQLRKKNIPYFFGDATDVEFLCQLPLREAKMIISTFPDADDQITLIKQARALSNRLIIVGNLSFAKQIDQMYEAGADYVILPHQIAGHWLAETLKKNNWTRASFKKFRKNQQVDMKLKINFKHY